MPLEQAIAPPDFQKLNREGHRKWTRGLGSPLQAERPSPIALTRTFSSCSFFLIAKCYGSTAGDFAWTWSVLRVVEIQATTGDGRFEDEQTGDGDQRSPKARDVATQQKARIRRMGRVRGHATYMWEGMRVRLPSSNCLAQAQNARETACLPAVQLPPSQSQPPHFGLNQRRVETKKMLRLSDPARKISARRHRIQESCNLAPGLHGRVAVAVSHGTIRVPKGKDEESEMHIWRVSPWV